MSYFEREGGWRAGDGQANLPYGILAEEKCDREEEDTHGKC